MKPALHRLLHRLGVRRGDLFDLAALTPATRGPNMHAIRELCQNAYLGGDDGLCRVLGRFKMYVDTRDISVSSHLMLDGYWELWVTELIVERLKPGMIGIDIGANLGYFTVLMADLAGPNGHVHAFEPNPEMARRIRASAHVNGFGSAVSVYADPLGKADGEPMTLVIPDRYPGGAYLIPTAPETPGVLHTRRLDSFPELLDADLIKIDAEGAEWAIWQGMEGLLARRRPMTIFLEFVANRCPDPSAFLDAIEDQGFELHYVSGATPLRRIRREDILTAPGDEEAMLVLIR